MAKAKEVLRRLVRLADSGKLSDERINGILNGMHINGTHEYVDGRLKDLRTGAISTLSPDRINTVLWPSEASAKPQEPKKRVPAITPPRKPKPDAGIKPSSKE